MDDYRLVTVLACWLFVVIEGSVWIAAAGLGARWRKLSANTRAWSVRIACLKLWLTVALLAVALPWLGPYELGIGALSLFVAETAPLIHFVALSGLAGILLFFLSLSRVQTVVRRIADRAKRLEDVGSIEPFVRLAKPFESWHVPIVLVTRDAPTPALLGLWRQAVILPERLTDDGITNHGLAALAHELAHVKRRDPAWSFLILSTVAALPWNPILHFAANAYRDAVEEACDELVVNTRSIDSPTYAAALAGEATGTRRPSRLEGLAFGAPSYRTLAWRLEALAASRTARQPARWVASTLLVLLAVAPSSIPILGADLVTERRRLSIGVPHFDIVWIEIDPAFGPPRTWQVNSKGEVALNANWRRPFLWSEERGLEPLTTDQLDSQVNCINEYGLMAGGDHRKMGVYHAPKEYDVLNGLLGHVWDVSDSGFLAGRWDKDTSVAFRFHPTSGLEQIPVPSVYEQSVANSVNSRGYVVGSIEEDQFQLRRALPFLWDGESPPIVLPLPADYPIGSALSISDDALVIGTVKDSRIMRVLPIAWPTPSSYTLMEQLPLAPNGAPRTVNNNGWSVGRSWATDEFESTATIWTPDYGAFDLNECVELPFGWRLTEAFGIADNLLIVATAVKGGTQRAVLLKPKGRR